MAAFLIFINVFLAVVLFGIYSRLSPLKAFSDQRKARSGAQESRREAIVTEGEELLQAQRGLIRELLATVELERGTADERRGWLDTERGTSEELRVQLDAACRSLKELLETVRQEHDITDERQGRLDEVHLTAEGLRGYLDAMCSALDTVLRDLAVERSDFIDALYHVHAPDGAKEAFKFITARRAERAHARQEREQGEKHTVRDDEETKPQGAFRIDVTPGGERTALIQQEHALSQEFATLAGEEQPAPARPAMHLAKTKHFEEQQKHLAATATGKVDAQDPDATLTYISKADITTALEAEAGGATPQSVPLAVHSGVVAPPAPASPPTPDEPVPQAASSAWKPQGPHGARPPAPHHRTAPIVGMHAVHPQQTATAPDDNDDATEVSDHVALPHALRSLAPEELRGLNGVPEAAPGHHLSPDQETPRITQMTEVEAGK
jgi:hypothetical protein